MVRSGSSMLKYTHAPGAVVSSCGSSETGSVGRTMVSVPPRFCASAGTAPTSSARPRAALTSRVTNVMGRSPFGSRDRAPSAREIGVMAPRVSQASGGGQTRWVLELPRRRDAHRQLDDGRAAVSERGRERRREIAEAVDPAALRAEGAGEGDEVGVGEIGLAPPPGEHRLL